jgi:hypothetical protein
LPDTPSAKMIKNPIYFGMLPILTHTMPTSRLRQALALLIYAIALVLDFAAAALGRLAALVAGDDWPA